MGPRAFTASAFCRLSDPRQPHGRPRGERRSHPRAQLGNFSRTCKPRSLRRGKEANPTFCSLPDFLAGLFCVCMYGGQTCPKLPGGFDSRQRQVRRVQGHPHWLRRRPARFIVQPRTTTCRGVSGRTAVQGLPVFDSQKILQRCGMDKFSIFQQR